MKKAYLLGFVGSIIITITSFIWLINSVNQEGAWGYKALGFLPVPMLSLLEFIGGILLCFFFYKMLKTARSLQNQNESSDIDIEQHIAIVENAETKSPTRGNNVKLSNEWGVAGFVFSSILFVHDGFLKFNCNSNMFNDVNAIERYIGLIISFLLVLSSTIASIVGVRKGSNFQKGLAIFGLVINIVLWIALIYTFLWGYFGDHSVGRRVN